MSCSLDELPPLPPKPKKPQRRDIGPGKAYVDEAAFTHAVAEYERALQRSGAPAPWELVEQLGLLPRLLVEQPLEAPEVAPAHLLLAGSSP